MTTLITGGAGYIGSHTAKELTRRGRKVVIFDNLSTGWRDFLRWGTFEEGDLGDTACLDRVFEEHDITDVVHFAGFIAVGESVQNPDVYYRNNVSKTLTLLSAMVHHGVKRMVFSSSASVYGEPKTNRIDEDHPLNPMSPYAWSKRIMEQMLADYNTAYGLRSVCLRYFNAAGADVEAEVGERHQPETHLIPLILAAAAGRRPTIKIFGTDYPTPDGTCLRDYIHVTDLADAHVRALDHLADNNPSEIFNLSNGNGFSVREIIDVAREVTGLEIPTEEASPRPGDSPALVGASEKAHRILDWQPERDNIRDIVASAWKWHCKDWS